jgi:SAM-dependent methyltransferase
MHGDLRFDHDGHFAFGQNWARYGKSVDMTDVADAQQELARFLELKSLSGKRFLDVGCGSGIHALAALRLGADFVHAVDFDPVSVETAKLIISEYWNKDNYKVEAGNILTLSRRDISNFDIVYSWGVLHHTGDMWTAIERAANFVADGGLFAIAIYRRTPLCGFWRWEKKLFTRGGPVIRAISISVYVTLRFLRDLVRLKNPFRIRSGDRRRGMKWSTDIIDWLGGYPYESASADEIRRFVEHLGLGLKSAHKTRVSWGLLGTGNAEYLFEKPAA